MSAPFRDRQEAGTRLAGALTAFAKRSDLLVLGLPRGGVPVAHAVAIALGAPLDVYLVRKLGLPRQPELAMGAIASGGVEVLNDEVIRRARVDRATIDAVAAREWRELTRREAVYRPGRPPLDPRERTIIVVDDGLATGTTMLAAIAALRQSGAGRVVVAVPVAPRSAIVAIQAHADQVVALYAPEQFDALGSWYDDFRQTTDAEVQAHLSSFPRRTI